MTQFSYFLPSYIACMRACLLISRKHAYSRDFHWRRPTAGEEMMYNTNALKMLNGVSMFYYPLFQNFLS